MRRAIDELQRVIAMTIPAGPEGELQRATAAGVLAALERLGAPVKIVSDQDMPPQHQHCLIWMRGGEHWAHATCNIDAHNRKYFILANSGTARRAADEVTHWMPMPPDPNG